MTLTAHPGGGRRPPPMIDLAIDGVFHLPLSEDSRRQNLALGTVAAALLLHLALIALLLSQWRMPALPAARPMEVTLVREAPKPPPKAEQPKPKPPPEKPKPKPAMEKPKPPAPPKPVEMKPRVSGPDLKTEAAKRDQPKTDLPPVAPVQPKPVEVPPPPETLPQPPEPKPVPPRIQAKASAAGKGVLTPLPTLPAALQPQRRAAPAMRTLTLRLPAPGSGGAERDFEGDAYLNRLKNLLERNRLYPPADNFAGALARRAVFGVVIEPSGAIVNVTLMASTNVTVLDEAAREMITNSSPFPHLPPDYPQIRTYMTVIIPVYPR